MTKEEGNIEQTNAAQPVEHSFEDHQKIQSEVEDEPSFSSDDGFIQNVFTTLSGISSEIINLRQIFEGRLKYDKTKDEAFDRLYTELDSFKKNSAFNAIRPLFVDLILLFDRIENIRQEIIQTQDANKINITELLGSLSEEIIEILYRHGVDLIKNTSSTFDPIIQQAISTQPTENEAENNAIVQVIRKGFKYQDRIVRPEEVTVKKYNKKF